MLLSTLGGLAQLGERYFCKVDVSGSNPLSSMSCLQDCSPFPFLKNFKHFSCGVVLEVII